MKVIKFIGIDPGNPVRRESFRYVGIDPGNNGAIAFMQYLNGVHTVVNALDMPTIQEQIKDKCKVRTEPDFDELLNIFDQIVAFNPDFVILEQLWAQLDSAMTEFA